jgi:hypothetical protein
LIPIAAKNLLESRLAEPYLLPMAGFSLCFRTIDSIWGAKNARD